jgi:hypothetical protein
VIYASPAVTVIASSRCLRYSSREQIPSRYLVGTYRVQEAFMTTGLILLALLAFAAAFGYTRVRGKMKLPIAGKHWSGAMIITGIVLLLLWASHGGGKH